MKTCNEKTRLWPDALVDVSSDEMNEFLTHAEACPYHHEILLAEDAELRSVFRRARGLDKQGRILLGADLDAAIAEQERRSKIWKESLNKESTISQISLWNGGTMITSCSIFFDFPGHLSLHELDPEMGIQLRGSSSGGNENEGVLLGFYALAGVRHNREDEHRWTLDNGFTIGLKIEKLGDKDFGIHLRCVETRLIDKERTEDGADLRAMAKGAGANNSSFGGTIFQGHASADHVLPEFKGWQPPARWPTPVLYASLIFAMTLISAGFLWKSFDLANAHAATTQSSGGNPLKASTTPIQLPQVTANANVDSNNQNPAAAANQSISWTKWNQGIVGKRQRNLFLPASTKSVERALRNREGLSRYPLVAERGSQPSLTSAANALAKLSDKSVKFAPTWEILSFGGTPQSATNLIISHVGTDKNIEEQLLHAMPGTLIPRGSKETNCLKTALTITWNVPLKKEITEKGGAIVQVRIIISSDAGPLSDQCYVGVGDCLAHAYESAFKKAVQQMGGVFGGMTSIGASGDPLNSTWANGIPPSIDGTLQETPAEQAVKAVCGED